MKRSRFVPAFVLTIVLSAPVGAQDPCPSQAPPAGVDPTSLRDRARILAYARSLQFHAAEHPTGETRRLTDISTPGTPDQRRYRLGPNASARPQVCAHRNTSDDLRAGRIIGMQTLDAAYPKLGLPQGNSYLWVDQLDGNTARGVVIPDDDRTPARVVQIRVNMTPDLPPRSYAEARWLFNPNDDDLWIVCLAIGCCELIGPGGP